MDLTEMNAEPNISATFRRAEALMVRQLGVAASDANMSVVFIVGAPRTGSTFLYQLMAGYLGLGYFSNLTNDNFPLIPAVGLAIQKSVMGTYQIEFRSRFGKALGELQPSEASAIMANWCGGGHPSQTVSATVLSGRKEHFRSTVAVANALFDAPLVIKNPWNSFRIDSLARTFPGALFVWIRRDIRNAALSDLHARYVTKDCPDSWNSATPSNVAELQKLPPWAQVVENQYEFHRAIHGSLCRLPASSSVTVWYEELCHAPAAMLTAIGGHLPKSVSIQAPDVDNAPIASDASHDRLSNDEVSNLLAYVSRNRDRFDSLLHRARE